MTKSHNVKKITMRLTCSICKEDHPTPLHGYVPKVMKDKSDGSQDNGDSGNIKGNYATLDDYKTTKAQLQNQDQSLSACVLIVSR